MTDHHDAAHAAAAVIIQYPARNSGGFGMAKDRRAVAAALELDGERVEPDRNIPDAAQEINMRATAAGAALGGLRAARSQDA
jgi:hypothetical protein